MVDRSSRVQPGVRRGRARPPAGGVEGDSRAMPALDPGPLLCVPMKWLALALGAVAVVIGIVAVVYYMVPAHSLPSLLGPHLCPTGRAGCMREHRVHRGESAAIAAAVVLLIGGLLYVVARRAEASGTSLGRQLLGK